MTASVLRLSELRLMAPEEREARLHEFAQGRFAAPNGEVRELDERIAEFEARYEISSEAMLATIRERSRPETADLCAWLTLLELRGKLVGQAR